MRNELLYTSAPKGLRSGTHGFSTVVATAGFPANLWQRVENCSAYRPLYPPQSPEANLNPIAWSHVRMQAGGERFHILSRVAPYGTDYSGRTNKLAHHILIDSDDELPQAGPAWLLMQRGLMRDHWDGVCRTLETPPQLPSSPRLPQGPCRRWEKLTGDGGWGAIVAAALAEPGSAVWWAVYDIAQRDEILPLMVEALSLLEPAKRWRATFSTYYSNLPAEAECRLRWVPAGSDEARQARQRGCLVDLTQPGSRAPDNVLSAAARTGVARQLPTRTPTGRPPSSNILAGHPTGDPLTSHPGPAGHHYRPERSSSQATEDTHLGIAPPVLRPKTRLPPDEEWLESLRAPKKRRSQPWLWLLAGMLMITSLTAALALVATRPRANVAPTDRVASVDPPDVPNFDQIQSTDPVNATLQLDGSQDSESDDGKHSAQQEDERIPTGPRDLSLIESKNRNTDDCDDATDAATETDSEQNGDSGHKVQNHDFKREAITVYLDEPDYDCKELVLKGRLKPPDPPESYIEFSVTKTSDHAADVQSSQDVTEPTLYELGQKFDVEEHNSSVQVDLIEGFYTLTVRVRAPSMLTDAMHEIQPAMDLLRAFKDIQESRKDLPGKAAVSRTINADYFLRNLKLTISKPDGTPLPSDQALEQLKTRIKIVFSDARNTRNVGPSAATQNALFPPNGTEGTFHWPRATLDDVTQVITKFNTHRDKALKINFTALSKINLELTGNATALRESWDDFRNFDKTYPVEGTRYSLQIDSTTRQHLNEESIVNAVEKAIAARSRFLEWTDSEDQPLRLGYLNLYSDTSGFFEERKIHTVPLEIIIAPTSSESP